MINEPIDRRLMTTDIEHILETTDGHSCEQGETINYREMAIRILLYLDENFDITLRS